MAIICCSCGALGWMGPLDPIGTGRGGIGGGGMFTGARRARRGAALGFGASPVAASALPEAAAPGAGFLSSSHAASVTRAARAKGAEQRRA
jgi:hypothetical protein